MRITFNTIYEFLADLRTQVDQQGPDCVFQKCVRLSQSTRELDVDGVKHLVNLQVSAITSDAEGEYLMEAGEDCGTDYLEDPPEKKGSETAAKKKQMITDVCDDLGLRVRPGLIES